MKIVRLLIPLPLLLESETADLVDLPQSKALSTTRSVSEGQTIPRSRVGLGLMRMKSAASIEEKGG
jgi:hypothetical protein